MQFVLQMQQFLSLAQEQFGYRDTSVATDHVGHVLVGNSLRQNAFSAALRLLK